MSSNVLYLIIDDFNSYSFCISYSVFEFISLLHIFLRRMNFVPNGGGYKTKILYRVPYVTSLIKM